jgi:hypothetical protein
MVDSVTINEPTESEIEPESVEDQETEQVEEQQTEEASERPEWLPEKFKSAEDMAKAYSELESKIGQKGEEGEEGEETQSSFNILDIQEQYAETGEVSEEGFKALEQIGIPKEYVERYIAGQVAIRDSQIQKIYDVAGGEERYEEINSWASENLNDSEIDYFNEQLNSQDFSKSETAIKGLVARFNQDQGIGPDLIKGSTSGSGGVRPYSSMGEYLEAMGLRDQTGKKKYEHDSSYRKQVEKRLEISNIF